MEDIIFLEKRAEWDQLRSKECTDNFTANATDNFSPEFAVMPTRNIIRESRNYLKNSLDVPKCCACLEKFVVATIERVKSTNSVQGTQ